MTDGARDECTTTRGERERRASDESDVYERQDEMRARLAHVFDSPNTRWGRDTFERIVAAATRDAQVLEIGSSIGVYGEHLLALGARRVVGIDVSQRLVAEARTREIPGQLEFILGDAGTPLDGTFDFIVGQAILHHLDWREVLPRLYEENLAPGGAMAFWEPLGSSVLLRLYRRAAPGLKTPDEAPFMRRDIRWLRSRFDLEFVPVNYVTLPVGVLSSFMMTSADNMALRIADRIDRRLARLRFLAPSFRNAIFVIRKPGR